MANSVEQICNMALGRCGVTQWIDSIDEDTEPARACLVYYAQARDELLAKFDWPFARRREDLALLGEGWGGWTYAYQLPGDCLAPRELDTGLRMLRADQRPRYVIEEQGGHQILLTDTADARLVYTARVETAPTFSAAFVKCLSWMLGAELVVPLAQREETANKCLVMARQALGEAIAQAMNEQEPDLEPDGEFLAARGGSPGFPWGR